jgi:hypothetical protein
LKTPESYRNLIRILPFYFEAILTVKACTITVGFDSIISVDSLILKGNLPKNYFKPNLNYTLKGKP